MKVGAVEHWPIRPATKPIPRSARMQDNFIDFTGRTFGAMRIVGFLGKKGAQVNSRWLARCTCGAYEPRTAKAIKSGCLEHDECVRCTYRRKEREDAEALARALTEHALGRTLAAGGTAHE